MFWIFVTQNRPRTRNSSTASCIIAWAARRASEAGRLLEEAFQEFHHQRYAATAGVVIPAIGINLADGCGPGSGHLPALFLEFGHFLLARSVQSAGVYELDDPAQFVLF